MRRRHAVLAIAAVAAVVAAALAWSVVGGGDRQVPRAAQPVEVLRLTSAVPRGTPASSVSGANGFDMVTVARQAAPQAVVGSPEELAGLVAAFDIPAGTVLAAGMFVAPTRLAGGLVDRLSDPGTTALPVTLDASRAAGGWLVPGDRVNVLVPSACTDEEALRSRAASLPVGGQGVDVPVEVRCRGVRYLYQAAEVLSVGAVAAPVAGDPGPPPSAADGMPAPAVGTVTVVLALPPRAAQWVASYDNDLVLALVRPDYLPQPVPPLPGVVPVLPGEDAALLTPYCPDPAGPAVTAVPPGTSPSPDPAGRVVTPACPDGASRNGGDP